MANPLSVSCPDCEARKNNPCVYLWPKNWDGTPRTRDRWIKSPTVLEQMDRAGEPMKRFHNGRSRKAWLKEQVAKRKAREAAYAEKNAASRDRDAILKANAQAVQDEHQQLLSWLKEYATVLTGGE